MSGAMPRMLFVGPVDPFLTTAARRDAFLEMGVPVETLDTRDFLAHSNPWLSRLTFWSGLTPPVFALNRAIVRAAERFRPEMVWIEKGTFVFPRTVRALRANPGRLLVHHNTDDWRAQTPLHRWQWRHLLRSMRLYDVHITSNLHNVEELRAAGFPRVIHMELASNPALPLPQPLSEAERLAIGGSVGFIGHWEPATERMALRLLAGGVALRIYGPNWENARAKSELAEACTYRSVFGQDYTNAVAAFDINIGIVSKRNRNHTASRTFQIPALGAFLLHERNELVRRYFEEGVEAAFFEGDDELLSQCRHYLDHPEARARIAAAGRLRCERSGYSEPDRVRALWPQLEAALHQHAGASAL